MTASVEKDVVSTSSSDDMIASLQRFAEVAEQVASTTKKLEKTGIVGSYLKQLIDADLGRAARYFAGHQFAQNDARTTNVGGSIISTALSEATGLSFEELGPIYVRLGDAGETAHEAIEEAQRFHEPTISLAETESIITRLSETRGIKNKTSLLTTVLGHATPLEAKYLIKLLAGDLRIGLREGLVEDAIARAFERPLAKVAQVNMLLGDIGETAVRARANDLQDVNMRLFHPIKFMLATPAADLADVARTMPDEFFVEDKFDGIRAQAHTTKDGRVAIYSRTMDEITHRFPELVSPLRDLAMDAVIDGEIVPARGERILPFSELQKRLGRKTIGEDLLAEVPVILVAYDLLYAAGRVLTEEPLHERRKLLEQMISQQGIIRVSLAKRFAEVAALDEEFNEARARGNEGLMIKSPASFYKPGRRGREWLKLKRAIATLDVVVTAVEVGHGKRRNLLSDYTFAVRRSDDDDELLNIGKAYSGLTDAELAEMTEWFTQHTIREFAHGRVRLVQPEMVIEVTFDRIQESKRHKSGYALRFPRILRLRPDKKANEIDTLDTVQKLVAQNSNQVSQCPN